MTFDRFSEYKHLSQDSARISDRRETINNIYLSVNSVLLGAIAVLVQQGGLKDIVFSAVAAFIAFAGLAITRDWKQLVENYRELLRLRFKALKELEEQADFPGVIKIYHRETELYGDGKGLFGFSPVEVKLPGLFSILYLVAIFAILVGSIILNYAALAAIFNLPSFAMR